MRRRVPRLAIVLACCILIAAVAVPAAFAAGKWWIVGTVTGAKTQSSVITLKLVRLETAGERSVVETSTNKYGQYAFSDPGEGLPPSAYRLSIYVGSDHVTDVSLQGVRPGGRVPPIKITW